LCDQRTKVTSFGLQARAFSHLISGHSRLTNFVTLDLPGTAVRKTDQSTKTDCLFEGNGRVPVALAR